jgi:peptidoglycan/xylan/chitin deacetylase (PgdA/CDA1 family)
MRRLARRWLAGALYWSGLLWLYAAFKLRGKAVVLMYHRVLPAGSDTFSHAGIVVTPETFARHLRFLSRHFRMLDLHGLRNELAGPAFSRRACLVTFDDGWQDNHRFALPLLQRERVPATIFIATDYIGSQRTFWQERLTRLLYHAARTPGFGDQVLRDLRAEHVRTLAEAEARDWARGEVTRLKRAGEIARAEQLQRALEAEAVGAHAGAAALGEDRFMSWDEVRALGASGLVQLGSHTHTHSILPALGYAGAREEFVHSRRVLQERGIADCGAGAYPNGIVDDEVARAAKDAGLSLAFVTRNQLTAHGDDPLRLRRVNIHEQATASNPELLCLILGVL